MLCALKCTHDLETLQNIKPEWKIVETRLNLFKQQSVTRSHLSIFFTGIESSSDQPNVQDFIVSYLRDPPVPRTASQISKAVGLGGTAAKANPVLYQMMNDGHLEKVTEGRKVLWTIGSGQTSHESVHHEEYGQGESKCQLEQTMDYESTCKTGYLGEENIHVQGKS